MQALRVHSCDIDLHGHVPYLTLWRYGREALALDFSNLEPPSVHKAECPKIAFEKVYDLLCGNAVQVLRGVETLDLTIERDAVRIANLPSDRALAWEHRVWLVEFALGWNLLRPSQAH